MARFMLSVLPFDNRPVRAPNSKNSTYVDIGANFDVTNDFAINVRFDAGYQTVEISSTLSYPDWKAAAAKDFGVFFGVFFGELAAGGDRRQHE